MTHTKTTVRAAFTLDPTALYLGDNGMCLCGAHLGYTAATTGRDLSGQRILKVTPDMIAREGMVLSDFTCERFTCGRTLSRPS